MKEQSYKIDTLTIVQNQDIRSDCADITFLNLGGSVVTINSALQLQQGSSITFSANANEIDRTIYTVSFSQASQFRKLIVFRKVYI